ncbi:molybdopterin-dependent oxidoreductase [Streptomyces sp. NPDC012474]|uniref:molybdopterin-dependent oxidoreductase n=1 Tax=Streptomyces sp. NPDC012474 TaxID=3364836 RepID=UPI0036E88F33
MTADTAWHKSACILCENNCGIQIQTDGRRFAKIRGDKEHVATAGYTCDKALRLDHYQNGGTRLTTPLRREADGSFSPIDWDTAVTEIAARPQAVRDAHGGESIFFYGGGGQGNHLGGAYVPHPGHRIALPIPELLGLDTTPAVHTSADFPIVLAAGQRRATANTIFRDNTWPSASRTTRCASARTMPNISGCPTASWPRSPRRAAPLRR